MVHVSFQRSIFRSSVPGLILPARVPVCRSTIKSSTSASISAVQIKVGGVGPQGEERGVEIRGGGNRGRREIRGEER